MPLITKTIDLLCCLSVVAGVLVAVGAQAAAPPKSAPQHDAVAAYQDGAHLLNTGAKSDLDRAEKLFNKAAVLGLPEAYFGLACAIYQSKDLSRARQAFAYAEHAAALNVIEGKALLVSYYWTGFGTSRDIEKWEQASRDLYQQAEGPPGKSAPELIDIIYIDKCGPKAELYNGLSKPAYPGAMPNPSRVLPDDSPSGR